MRIKSTRATAVYNQHSTGYQHRCHGKQLLDVKLLTLVLSYTFYSSMNLTWVKGPLTWIAGLQQDADLPITGAWQMISESPSADAKKLTELLLGIGGNAVVIPFVDGKQCAPICETGRRFDTTGASLCAGQQSDCHTNASRIWNRQQGKVAIGTGYALSEDEMWRRHSWCITRDNKIVETTVPRIEYFGLQLDSHGAGVFCSKNFTTSRIILFLDRFWTFEQENTICHSYKAGKGEQQ